MIKSHKKFTASLLVWAVIAGSVGAISPQSASAASVSSNLQQTAAVQTAVIESSVRLRSAPSTSSKVLTYLKKGEIVAVLEKTNKYFYKVSTPEGVVGYTSAADKYISLAPASSNGSTGTGLPGQGTVSQSQAVEKVVSAGLRYLGTPYEYGSSRKNTATFDCSDFVRQMFLDGVNLQLPADSRQQGDWVKQNSTVVTAISGLKRGDLMFFMSYRGNSASAYAGVNKSAERITHVALYLGDGQILHTYSASSGGVRVDQLSTSWMNRFLFGGSVIR